VKKSGIFILIFSFVFSINAQDNFIHKGNLNYHFAQRYEILSGKMNQNTDLAAGSFTRMQLVNNMTILSKVDSFNQSYIFKESTELLENTKRRNKLNLYQREAFFYSYTDPNHSEPTYSIHLNPILGLEIGQDRANMERGFLYKNTRGAEIRGFVGNKNRVNFYSSVTENQMLLPSFSDYYSDSIGVVPGQAFWKPFKDRGYDFFEAKGYIWFNINKHIETRFGHDRIQWGNGIRSLILSDVSPNNLFLQFNTKVGKFHYQNYFVQFKDKEFGPLSGSTLVGNKYGTFHRLGINLRKNINIGLYEAIVFDRSDPTDEKGFDLNYLNPIIFYRAIEQNQGSRDNAMMGLDFKWNIFKKMQIYSQFVLDEFKLNEIRNQTGWWANKFSFQAGYKYINVANVKNLDFELEYNTVRPFTYSHFRTGGSWTNFNQAIAHPLGANFRELVSKIHYQPFPRLHIQIGAMYAMKGEDSLQTNKNYGGNIHTTYSNRIREYDNYTTQGLKNNLLILNSNISYMFYHNMFVDLRYYYRFQQLDSNNFYTHWGSVGLRINLDYKLHDYYF
jgi:hypothetical protein